MFADAQVPVEVKVRAALDSGELYVNGRNYGPLRLDEAILLRLPTGPYHIEARELDGTQVGKDVVVELRDPGRPGDVLEVLRGADVRRVDVIVATDGDRADADAVVALRARFPGARIVAPPMHRVPGARSLHEGTRLELTGLRVEAAIDGEVRRLVVVPCPAASCVTVPPEETP